MNIILGKNTDGLLPHVVIGTPGRVLDMITKKIIDIDTVKVLVLDEADELLSEGFIVQIKQIGILFAIFALVIMGLDYLKHDNKKLFIKVIILTGILFALFLFEWTWKNYLTLQDIAKADSGKITIIKILTAFNPDTASEKQAVIINNFIDYFLFSHHLSTFWFLVTMLLMGGIVAIKNMNKTNAYISAFISTYIFFLAYITVLLILYLFIFSEYDGPRLASIDRYTVTYILGILVFFGGTLLNVNSREKTKKYKIYFDFRVID
jgi:hypothetical protein